MCVATARLEYNEFTTAHSSTSCRDKITHTHTAEYLSGLDENRTTHSHADVHVLAAATEQSGLKDES